MNTTPHHIGVISDTHGLLRPEALEALAGSELIIHAGDVGNAGILEALTVIAPVVAVRGNTDHGPFGASLSLSEVVEIDDLLMYVIHIPEDLDLSPEGAGMAVVIHGHTHRPRNEWVGDVLYLNPGSAGPRRFNLPVTVARLTVAPLTASPPPPGAPTSEAPPTGAPTTGALTTAPPTIPRPENGADPQGTDPVQPSPRDRVQAEILELM